MSGTRVSVLALCVLGVAGCASASHSGKSGPLRLSGDFRAPVGYSSAVFSKDATAHASSYGTVSLTPLEDAPDRTRVELSVTVPTRSGEQLAWGILQGSCGSANAPVTGPSEFPLIDIGPNGSGIVRATLPFRLDSVASYHANVYTSSRFTFQDQVLMCADLER